MTSKIKKTCLRCKAPFTDTGDAKEHYKGYHKGCMKCVFCDITLNSSNISSKHQPDGEVFCKECGLKHFSIHEKCIRCNIPFTETPNGREYFRGYHKSCMNCAKCKRPLDATNVYLTTERSKDLYCNECKGRDLSKECDLTASNGGASNNLNAEAAISEEAIWYDCCSSFNSTNQPAGEGQPVFESNGNHSSTLKNGSAIQTGYRDLHRRKSTENSCQKASLCQSRDAVSISPSGNTSITAENGKHCIGATKKIKTSIPQRITRNTIIKTASINNNAVIDSKNTASANIVPPVQNGDISSVKNEIFKSSVKSYVLNPSKPKTGVTSPEINRPGPSKCSHLESSGGQTGDNPNILQYPSDNNSKTLKNAFRKAFYKCSRILPTKNLPSKCDSKTAIDSQKCTIPWEKNDSINSMYLDCSICFDSLFDIGNTDNKSIKSNVVATSCGHIFHEKCIKEWLNARSNKKCPICCSTCNTDNLLTIFVDARPHRLGSRASDTLITNKENDQIQETFQNDYEDLKSKHEQLVAEHEFCGWKSIVIQSLQSAYDLESLRREELEKENELLLEKIQNMQLEAFIRQPFDLKSTKSLFKEETQN